MGLVKFRREPCWCSRVMLDYYIFCYSMPREVHTRSECWREHIRTGTRLGRLKRLKHKRAKNGGG